MLDTDICSYIIKSPNSLKKRFDEIDAGDIAVSAITWAELNAWVMNSSKPQFRLLSLQKMFAPIAILPFTMDDAAFHGSIKKHLKDKGQPIRALDTLIAAHAVARELTMVTNNTEHFRRVPNLKIENWLQVS